MRSAGSGKPDRKANARSYGSIGSGKMWSEHESSRRARGMSCVSSEMTAAYVPALSLRIISS